MCSRLHDSRAGARVRLQPKCTGRRLPRPYPCFVQSRGVARATRAESVGMHANLRRPCTSFYIRACLCVCVCIIQTRAAVDSGVRNSPHETNATFLRIRPCKSVQFAASRGAMRSLHCVVPRACDRTVDRGTDFFVKKKKEGGGVLCLLQR